jgi:hypothetical protein
MTREFMLANKSVFSWHTSMALANTLTTPPTFPSNKNCISFLAKTLGVLLTAKSARANNKQHCDLMELNDTSYIKRLSIDCLPNTSMQRRNSKLHSDSMASRKFSLVTCSYITMHQKSISEFTVSRRSISLVRAIPSTSIS